MTALTRRSLLTGAAAVAVAATVPLPAMPVKMPAEVLRLPAFTGGPLRGMSAMFRVLDEVDDPGGWIDLGEVRDFCIQNEVEKIIIDLDSPSGVWRNNPTPYLRELFGDSEPKVVFMKASADGKSEESINWGAVR